MTDYDIYVFLLCLIVFLLLTSLSVVCLTIITKLSLRLIRGGLEDEKIIEEHEKKQAHIKRIKYTKIADYVLSGVVCLAFVAVFIGSLLISCSEDASVNARSAFRVVLTGSMAEKHEDNEYLWQNGLDDQLQTFDLIRTEPLPDEMELELYDIVVYEVDDILLIHRIVEIEEPNAAHPDCRHFRFQGDAVESPDRFPVLYEQMRAIYRGDRTPFVGSFVLFMQSPAGWLCILLTVIAMIASPILDNVLTKEREKRLALILPPQEEGGESDD